MSYYKFEQNDIFTNRIKAHPRSYFLIHNNKTFYNDVVPQATVDSESILDIPQGFISLYEMNINRLDGTNDSNLIYPYITKQGTLGSFKSISTESFQGFNYGDIISGSYPLSASISTDYYSTSSFPLLERDRIYALKNTFNYYRPLSRHYTYETVDWNKSEQDMKLVSIPSIFYGSSIKKGSVKMNFYIEGELIATLEDRKKNGELIQTFGKITTFNPGSVASSGSIFFNNGFESNYDDKTIVLENTNGTLLTFIFDASGTEGSTGTIDGSGFVVIQIDGFEGQNDVIAEEFADAVNSSSIQITATSDFGLVDLTQNILGSSGDTVIQVPNSIQDLLLTNFSGGAGGGATVAESTNNGDVAGVVLYNEGFVALTGSWDLSSTHQEEYVSGQGFETAKWKYWGERDRVSPFTDFAKSSSWDIEFLGTSYIPTMTMFAHAKQADLNYSNNPTFIEYEDRNDGNPFKIITQEMIDDASLSFTQDDLGKVDFQNGGALNKFVEDKDLHIANIAQSPYEGAEAAFEKTTYISKIGIYDENKNLIGIAKLATPVKKTESRQYTFKMKVDF